MLAGRSGARRRRRENNARPSSKVQAGLGVGAVERAEAALNPGTPGKPALPLGVRLRSLQRNPQLGGSLHTGHYGRLLWRPSAPKHYNWRLEPALPSWKPSVPLFMGDAAEYRRRRQLQRREALKLQHRRSLLKPLPQGTKQQLMGREPRLQLLLTEHANYFRKPAGLRTWIARRRTKLQLRQAYHRPRHCQWLAELLRRAYPQSQGLAWLGFRSGYADGLQGLRRLNCAEAGFRELPRALLQLLRRWGGGLRRNLPRRRQLTFRGLAERRPGGFLGGFPQRLAPPAGALPNLPGKAPAGEFSGVPRFWGTPRGHPAAQALRGVPVKKSLRPNRGSGTLVFQLRRWQRAQNRRPRGVPKASEPLHRLNPNPLREQRGKTPLGSLRGTSALLVQPIPGLNFPPLGRYRRRPACPANFRRLRQTAPFGVVYATGQGPSADSYTTNVLWQLRQTLWQQRRLLQRRLGQLRKLHLAGQRRRRRQRRSGTRRPLRLRLVPPAYLRRLSPQASRFLNRAQIQATLAKLKAAAQRRPTRAERRRLRRKICHQRKRRRIRQPRAVRRLGKRNWQALRTRSEKTLRLRQNRRFPASQPRRVRPETAETGRPLYGDRTETNLAPDVPPVPWGQAFPVKNASRGHRWTAPVLRGGCLYLRGSWRRLWVSQHPRLGRRVLLGNRWRSRRWRPVRYHWSHGPLRRAMQRLRRPRRSVWQNLSHHVLQLERKAPTPGSRRIQECAGLFSKLLGKLLALLGGSGTPEPAAKPSAVPANGPLRGRALFTPAGQRLALLQRAAAVSGGFRPLGFNGPCRRATQPHPGLRLGLGALTTQEHLGRRNHRARRRGLWLRDWLRQCYMPPRMAQSHRLRSSNTPGLRYWFRPEELALLEPWQQPAHRAGWWQQEASGYLESRYSRNSEMGLWVRLMAAYAERFRWKHPTYTRRCRVAQRRPIRWALRRLPRQRLIYGLALGLLTLSASLPLLTLLGESDSVKQMRNLMLSVGSRPLAHGLQECGWAPNYRAHRYVPPYARWWQSMGRSKWIYHGTPLLREDHSRHWLRLSVHPDGAGQSHHFRQVIARQMAFDTIRNRTLNLILAPRRNNLRVIIQPWVVRDGWRDRVFERSAGQLSRFKGRLRRSPEIKRQLYQLAAFRLLRHHKKDSRFRFMRVVFKHYLESLPAHFHRPEQMRRQLWGLLGPFRRKQVSMRYPIVGLQTTESYSNRPRGYRRRSRKHVKRPKTKRY